MLNLIHTFYMFRLFLIIISVFMISSCSNTQPPKKKTINSLSLHEQQNMEKKSMILIMDFGDSESQIIKCCDSLLTYGVGYVETANKGRRCCMEFCLSDYQKKTRSCSTKDNTSGNFKIGEYFLS